MTWSGVAVGWGSENRNQDSPGFGAPSCLAVVGPPVCAQPPGPMLLTVPPPGPPTGSGHPERLRVGARGDCGPAVTAQRA